MSTVEGLNHAYTCNTQVLGLALITIGGLMLDSVNESLIDERLARLERRRHGHRALFLSLKATFGPVATMPFFASIR